MQDPRLNQLADVIVGYSLNLQAGEKVLIEAFDDAEELVLALIRKASAVGAIPLVCWRNNRIQRELFLHATEVGMELIGEIEKYRMERVQAYVGIRGSQNASEFSDVPQQQMKLYQRYWWKPVHAEIRVRRTKWVVLRYPSPSMAQQAEMSTQAFENFFFDVCTLDYRQMSAAMEALKALMEKTDQVHITGPGTDLCFSIKGMPAIKCDGKLNLPDGEIFTAPLRDSVNGEISFNTPTLYHGTVFQDIRLEFKDGKIIRAQGSDTEKLNAILDSDEGARFVGEFSIGLNPKITRPMKDILFDEKIAGSFHLTPGNAYDEADNGNRSEIHWDLVMIQTPEYGGGEIYFDDRLIRQDGRFVVAELEGLNPENLARIQ